jgi:hypothetical protein
MLKSFTRYQLRMASRSNSIVSATDGPSFAGGSALSQNCRRMEKVSDEKRVVARA